MMINLNFRRNRRARFYTSHYLLKYIKLKNDTHTRLW